MGGVTLGGSLLRPGKCLFVTTYWEHSLECPRVTIIKHHEQKKFMHATNTWADALPWAFLSCTLRNMGSPVQIAMANPLVVRRVITDPLHSIFYGGSLVLCLDLAMLCDPLMRLCVRRLRSHFTVTYLPLFPLTCTPTYASYSRSIRCPGTSRIQFICTRSKLQISHLTACASGAYQRNR